MELTIHLNMEGYERRQKEKNRKVDEGNKISKRLSNNSRQKLRRQSQQAP